MIYEKLLQIISDISTVAAVSIKMETTVDELQIDSLDKIDIAMRIEDEFNVKLDLKSNSTISEIVDLIEKKQNEQQG